MDTERQRKRPGKPGRKQIVDVARFRFTVRLNEEENNHLNELIARSGLKDKTKFVKHALFGKEIKVVKVDKAAMDYGIKLTEFYYQFQRIGNNYNQIVRALKTNFSEKRALSLLYQLEKATINLIVINEKIIRLTEEFKREWLQK